MGSISLKGVQKNYAGTRVIENLDLEVRDGEFLVFLGPSGCGKSTTLRMIAGLEAIDAGTLAIDGVLSNAIVPAERGVAMVFQSYALYPHMTVAENMAFALKMSGVPAVERQQQVSKVAQVLRIGEYLHRYPKDLSGGQRQRVAIGRAIVRKPRVFLFDEPLSNLDAALRVEMRMELTRLHRELGVTMVYVTHDQVEAMTMGDRIAVFNKGRIEQIGKPMDLYRAPATEFVAKFLGAPRINLVQRPEENASAQHIALWNALVGTIGNTDIFRFGVRPEHVQLCATGGDVDAEVVFAELLGDTSVLHLRIHGLDELWTAKIAGHVGSYSSGQSVGLQMDRAELLAFSRDGQALARQLLA